MIFKATKDINVFRFIKEIYSLGKITVTEFRKPSEIKDFLSKQWSDMFKNYLKLLKEKNDSKQIYDAMGNLQSLIKRMDIMVDGLGKKIIGNEDITYDIVLRQQTRGRAEEFAKKICDHCRFIIEGDIRRDKAVEKIYERIKNVLNILKKQNVTESSIGKSEIYNMLEEYPYGKNQIHVFMVDVNFFRNWKNNSEILSDEELDIEVLKVLQEDDYSKQLILEVD